MGKYDDFMNFVKVSKYTLSEEEKEFFKSYFKVNKVNFKFDFGKKVNVGLLLEYYKKKNIYNSTFNPLSI